MKTKTDWEGAVAYLKQVCEEDIRKMVIQFAGESNVTPERWLEKCTVDVVFRVVKGLEGEEVVWECKARKRVAEDGPPRLTFL